MLIVIQILGEFKAGKPLSLPWMWAYSWLFELKLGSLFCQNEPGLSEPTVVWSDHTVNTYIIRG